MSVYAQPATPATTSQRIQDMAASLLAAHGPYYGNRAFQFVKDPARAAQLRQWEAERLIGDQDRRARAYATGPCVFCGEWFSGERIEVSGRPMCADCASEFGATHAPAELAPLTPDAELWAAYAEGRADERADLLACGRLATDLRIAPILPDVWGEMGRAA